MASIGWSPATPADGITANIIDVGAGNDDGFAKAGASVRDAIVLVHANFLVTWDDLVNEYNLDKEIIDRATKAGGCRNILDVHAPQSPALSPHERCQW